MVSTQNLNGLRKRCARRLRPFREDLIWAINWAQQQPSGESIFPAWVVIGAFFGLVEGFTYTLGREVLRQARSRGGSLSPKAEAILTEKVFRAESIEDAFQYRALTQRLSKASTEFLGLLGETSHPMIGDEGWKAFKNLATVRRKMTHPETYRDFVAPTALEHLQATVGWFEEFSEIVLGPVPEKDSVRSVFPAGSLNLGTSVADDSEFAVSRISSGLLAEIVRMVVVSFSFKPSANGMLDGNAYDTRDEMERASRVRAYARTEVVTVEALRNAVRRGLEELRDAGAIGFSPAENGVLADAKGGAKNLAEVFELWSSKVGSGGKVPRTGKNYSSFQRMLKLRDRITHPSKPKSFHVSLNDLSACLHAGFWICDTTKLLMLDDERWASLVVAGPS